MSGAVVEAYSSEGPSFSASIADILFQETQAKSLVVSASSSFSFASALGVHPQLVKANNAHTYSFKNGAFSSNYVSGSNLLELSEEAISLLVDTGVSGVVFSTKTSVLSLPFSPLLFYLLFALVAPKSLCNCCSLNA